MHIITVVLKRVTNGDNHPRRETPELTRGFMWTLLLDLAPLMFSSSASKHVQCWKEAVFDANPHLAA